MDAPMIVPTTIAVARPRPIARTRGKEVSEVAEAGTGKREHWAEHSVPATSSTPGLSQRYAGSRGIIHTMPTVVEKAFQLLFKYRPAVFAEGDLPFGLAGPVVLVVLAGAVAVAAALLTYRRVGAHSTRRDRAVLAWIRMPALALVLAF